MSHSVAAVSARCDKCWWFSGDQCKFSRNLIRGNLQFTKSENQFQKPTNWSVRYLHSFFELVFKCCNVTCIEIQFESAFEFWIHELNAKYRLLLLLLLVLNDHSGRTNATSTGRISFAWSWNKSISCCCFVKLSKNVVFAFAVKFLLTTSL